MSDEKEKAGKGEAFKEARELVESTQLRLDRARKISDEARYRIQEELNALRQGIERDDEEYVREVSETIEMLAGDHLAGVSVKPVWREYAETIGLAILCALILRAFFFEAFKIPSGSMEPTLISGDYIFVNKLRYGVRVPFTTQFVLRFAEPERGEVVVFRFPAEEAREYVAQERARQIAAGERTRGDCVTSFDEKDFIKRIIGLPGDVIEGRNARLYVNGQPLERTPIRRAPAPEEQGKTAFYSTEKIDERTYQIREDRAPGRYDDRRDFGPITVADGHFFAVGDNRDNSADSRCWGQVPKDYIKGRAMIIWMSVRPPDPSYAEPLAGDEQGDGRFRWERFGLKVR